MPGQDRLAPLYAQVKRKLQTRIEGGELAEGDFLPPEPQLCRDFGVSRITLRRAVTELCDAGLLIRQQGRGTVVAARKLRQTLVSLSGFADTFEAAGRALVHDVVEAQEQAQDAAAAAVLGSAGGLCRLVRLIGLDGRPFTLETLRFSPGRLPGVFGPVAAGASFFQALRTTGGPQPATAERAINVGYPAPDEARRLDIAQSQPVFRIDKTLFDAAGGPIALSHLVTPADRITYTLRSERMPCD